MRKDIIVIGGSAGSIEPLRQAVGALPPDLPAAVFVVVHIPAWRRSELPAILEKSGRLPALHPSPDEPIKPGHIYVAPPDYHMIIEDSQIRLWRGPKENLHRPAINALFRSAAVECGRRVVGTILSGVLEDGITGLCWIKKYGGAIAVQDPETAAFRDMPETALKHVSADYVVKPREMGPLFSNLTKEVFAP